MKNTIVFKKAKIQHFSGFCKSKGKGIKKEYYETTDCDSHKNHAQSIEHTGDGIKIDCDCQHASLHQQKGVICSHIVSVILRKVSEIKLK